MKKKLSKRDKELIAHAILGAGFLVSFIGPEKILQPAKILFHKPTLEELNAERELVRQQFVQAGSMSDKYANYLERLLEVYDRRIHKLTSTGEPGFPVHSEHGWHLPSD